MLLRKLDKLEHKDPADEKKMRNLDFLEGARAIRISILDGIVHSMNSTYNKSPTMFLAAFVAYWLTQRKVHGAVSQYFHPAINYASGNEAGLFKNISSAGSASGSKK